jgi:Raf kinase inhibitor-like YbhB/YbcL family protein
MAFTLESSAFPKDGPIPPKYARSGANLSPPLVWKDAPAETRSYALIMEDPDAPSGTFRHWAIYNIAGARDRLPEATTAGAKTESLGRGVNDFGNMHYDGPQPPRGHGMHHYHFRLFALDVERLKLPAKAKAEEVLKAVQPHAIAETEMVGTFETR